MNINIIIDPSQSLSEYKNIVLKKDVQSLSELKFEDGEIKNLVLNHSFEYEEDSEQVLKILLSKVRCGGSVTLIGLNTYAIVSDFADGKITGDQFRNYIHGKLNKTWNFSEYKIVQLLVNLNFKITKMRLEGYEYTTVGVRQ